METNVCNDCVCSQEEASLMGEAVNWIGQQVKCPHPSVSFSHRLGFCLIIWITLKRVGDFCIEVITMLSLRCF